MTLWLTRPIINFKKRTRRTQHNYSSKFTDCKANMLVQWKNCRKSKTHVTLNRNKNDYSLRRVLKKYFITIQQDKQKKKIHKLFTIIRIYDTERSTRDTYTPTYNKSELIKQRIKQKIILYTCVYIYKMYLTPLWRNSKQFFFC